MKDLQALADPGEGVKPDCDEIDVESRERWEWKGRGDSRLMGEKKRLGSVRLDIGDSDLKSDKARSTNYRQQTKPNN